MLSQQVYERHGLVWAKETFTQSIMILRNESLRARLFYSQEVMGIPGVFN